MSSEHHVNKNKKDRKKLNKKCKEQRDQIIEMIKFMDEKGIPHFFKTPEEINVEIEEQREFVYEINGKIKIIKKRKIETTLPEDELDSRIGKLLSNKRKRYTS